MDITSCERFRSRLPSAPHNDEFRLQTFLLKKTLRLCNVRRKILCVDRQRDSSDLYQLRLTFYC